jgi:putative oxidoreductase
MQRWSAPIVLLGRLLLGFIFVNDGVVDLTQYADVASYMQAGGVSPRLLPLVIVTVLGGGLMVAAGFMTRWAAIALAGFCLATALLFHFASADAGEAIQFQKDLAIAGGFLILAAFGPGDWSLDAWLARRAPAS